MASKYETVIRDLPKLREAKSEDDPKYQQKVDAKKEEIKTSLEGTVTSGALAALYRLVRFEKEKLETDLKAINLRKEALEQLIVDSYESEGLSAVKLDTGETIRTRPEPYANVKDKDEFRRWCMDPQGGNLIESMSLPWPTTNALLKERLLAGEGEMPGVDAFVKTGVRFEK